MQALRPRRWACRSWASWVHPRQWALALMPPAAGCGAWPAAMRCPRARLLLRPDLWTAAARPEVVRWMLPAAWQQRRCQTAVPLRLLARLCQQACRQAMHPWRQSSQPQSLRLRVLRCPCGTRESPLLRSRWVLVRQRASADEDGEG